MRFKEFCDFLLITMPLSDGNRQLIERALRSVEIDIVQVKKQQRRHDTRPFVSINERVVLHNVKQIGGRHLVRKRVEQLFTIARTRLGDGRVQQSDISNARVAPISSNLIMVGEQDILNRQEIDLVHLFRQSFEIVTKSLIDFVERCLQSLLTTLVTHGRDKNCVTVRRQLERRIGRDFEHLQNRLVDDKREAVAMPDQGFVHCTLLQSYTHSVYRGMNPGNLILTQPDSKRFFTRPSLWERLLYQGFPIGAEVAA